MPWHLIEIVMIQTIMIRKKLISEEKVKTSIIEESNSHHRKVETVLIKESKDIQKTERDIIMILVILIIEEDTKNHILTIEDHITNHIPNLNPTVVQMKKKDILLENLNGDSEVLKKEDLLETLTTKKR